ncbi:MAG: hypothetical protein ACREOJ_11355 [Gemmatimonadaceae bacterium]
MTRPHSRQFDFPDGKRFAFTILDDADVGNVANLSPVYDLLERLGMRTTKTVWPVACPEGSRDYGSSQTLDDADYRRFVLDLARRGFEITWHGATMESSTRDRTLRALDQYRDVLGDFPRIHVNHAMNRENMYWGSGRLDSPLLRMLLRPVAGHAADRYAGHREGSPYWWGDRCAEHFTYARNLTTNDIDTARFNPSMPYRDVKRPLVPWWFSASDADDVDEFNALLHPRNQDRLERDGGFCIVATHLGKRFARGDTVHPATRELLRELAQRNGWFTTVGELLDHLRARREMGATNGSLPAAEWRRMQWRWSLDRTVHKLRRHG